MEGVFEEDSQLRRCVEHELLSELNISPEQALKVDSLSVKGSLSHYIMCHFTSLFREDVFYDL